MADCKIVNTTINEIKDFILTKKLAPKITELNQENAIHSLLAMRGLFKTASVPASMLDKKVRKELHLEESDMVETYINEKTGEVAVKKRATFDTKAKFIKVKGAAEAKRISQMADNIIKAGGGTRTHSALQHIMEADIKDLSERGDGLVSNIINNSTIEGYNAQYLSTKEISEATGISEGLLSGLRKSTREILELINAKQKEIDRSGKAMIMTETLITDGKDIASTVDLLVVFSDGSVGKFDYKTISPKYDAVKRTDLGYRIENENWIPGYKMEDFIIQFDNMDKILNKMGLTKRSFSRVVPIHIRFALKDKNDRIEGAYLTDKIVQLDMGVKADPFLKHIPIGEMTGIKSLDDRIDTLYTIINNLRYRINKMEKSDPKYTQLLAEINRKQRVVNNIIIDRDLEVAFKEFRIIADKYANTFGKLKNVSDEFIDGKPNLNYLSIDQLQALRTEVEAYRNIMDTSQEFLIEIENFSPEKGRKYLIATQQLSFLLGRMEKELLQLESDRILGDEMTEAMLDNTEGNWWSRMFRTLGDQMGPLFRIFSDKHNEALNKTRVKSMEHDKKTKEMDLGVEEWAKRNKKGIQQTYDDYLIDKESGNLIKQYKPELFDAFEKVQESGTEAAMDKFIELREDWEIIYKNNRQNFINARFIDIETKEGKAELADWEKRNNPKAMKKSKYFRVYYKFKPDVAKQYLTDEYNFLLRPENKELLDYYNHWTKSMEIARELFGLKYSEIPNNFLPWLRADAAEMLLQKGYGMDHMKAYLESLAHVKEDDLSYGSTISNMRLDPRTNEPLRDVPRWYTTPIKDHHGRIDAGLKSRDLSKSLSIFMNAAYAYYHKTTIVEPFVESLKDIAAMHGVKNIIDGKEVKTPLTGNLAPKTGKTLDSVKLLKTFIDFHLYGVSIQDADPKTAKVFQQLKSFQAKKELGFAVMTGVGNFLQIRTNAYLEGLKGFFYTNKHLNHAMAMSTGALGTEQKSLYDSIIEFLEPSPGIAALRAKNMSSKKALKVLHWDTMFYQFRKPEEAINNNIMVSIMQNYGWDKDGSLKRLKVLPEGSKSVLEGSRVEGDKLIIDGISDKDGNINWDNYTKLRNIAMQTAKGIKGQMNSDDVFAAHTSLIGNLVLGFKNWLPGMLDERISGVRYDPNRNAVVIGRWTSLISDMQDSERSFFSTLFNVVTPSVLRFAGDIATFGWLFNHGLKYKINEGRARAQFENFKSKYLHDGKIQAMTFEEFLDYKQGQIKAFAAELFVVLSLVTMLMLAAQDWDDDGKPDYKASMYSRTVYRILNRARREIAFFISPNDWTQLVRSPIPLTGLAVDAMRWLDNTSDEFGDVVWGEDTDRKGFPAIFGKNKGADKRPFGYETMRWIPGNKLFKSLEVFPVHEDAVY